MPQILKKIGVFILFVAAAAGLIYNFQIQPMLLPLIEAKAVSVVTDRVNASVLRVLSAEKYSADAFERLSYDGDGNVVSIAANAVKIAAISGELVAAVTKDLKDAEDLVVCLPLSNFFGLPSDKSRHPVRLALGISNQIGCEIKRDFYERGINQTLHRIYADLRIEIYVLLISGTHSFSVRVPCTLSETVIVGKVPQAYTHINRFFDDVSESEIDDIYDFGAAVE